MNMFVASERIKNFCIAGIKLSLLMHIVHASTGLWKNYIIDYNGYFIGIINSTELISMQGLCYYRPVLC